jgi:hypothetical protein
MLRHCNDFKRTPNARQHRYRTETIGSPIPRTAGLTQPAHVSTADASTGKRAGGGACGKQALLIRRSRWLVQHEGGCCGRFRCPGTLAIVGRILVSLTDRTATNALAVVVAGGRIAPLGACGQAVVVVASGSRAGRCWQWVTATGGLAGGWRCSRSTGRHTADFRPTAGIRRSTDPQPAPQRTGQDGCDQQNVKPVPDHQIRLLA